MGSIAIPSSHRFRRDEGIEHRFRCRFDGRLEEIVDLRVVDEGVP